MKVNSVRFFTDNGEFLNLSSGTVISDSEGLISFRYFGTESDILVDKETPYLYIYNDIDGIVDKYGLPRTLEFECDGGVVTLIDISDL